MTQGMRTVALMGRLLWWRPGLQSSLCVHVPLEGDLVMKRLSILLGVVVLAVGLSACGTLDEGQPGATIAPQATFSQPDGDAHPWVVAVLFQQLGDDGRVHFYSCTGTLLSEYVVLTAGHCTSSHGFTNFGTWVRNDASIDDARAIELAPNPTFGQFEDWANTYWISGQAVPHPDYADYAEFPNTYDVGLVLLDEPIVLDHYGELPALGLLDEMTSGTGHRDRLFTNVGYGRQGVVPAFYQDDWVRYTGHTTLINVNSLWAGDDQSAGFTNNPGKGNGSGGTCFGDSGGPLFVGESNVIGAVVSFGFTPCIGIDYNFRMDTETAQDFVAPYMSWDPPN